MIYSFKFKRFCQACRQFDLLNFKNSNHLPAGIHDHSSYDVSDTPVLNRHYILLKRRHIVEYFGCDFLISSRLSGCLVIVYMAAG